MDFLSEQPSSPRSCAKEELRTAQSARASKRLSALEQRLDDMSLSMKRIDERLAEDSKRLQLIVDAIIDERGALSRQLSCSVFQQAHQPAWTTLRRHRSRVATASVAVSSNAAGAADPRKSPIVPVLPATRSADQGGTRRRRLIDRETSHSVSQQPNLGALHLTSLGELIAPRVNSERRAGLDVDADGSSLHTVHGPVGATPSHRVSEAGSSNPALHHLSVGATDAARLPKVGALSSNELQGPAADPSPNNASRMAASITLLQSLRNGARIATTEEASTLDVDGPFVASLDTIFLVINVLTCMVVVTVWQPLTRINFDEMPHWFLLAWIGCVQIFSAAWIALRFFMRCRVGEWGVIDDLRQIRRTYLRRWFGFDVAYTLPIEFLFIGHSNRGFYYLLVRHFLRYVRVLSLGNSVNPLVASRRWFRFVSYCWTMCLLAHIVANVFWAIEGSNVTYVQSLYWAVASMTSVGYGDIVATADTGRVFAIGTMLLGILLISTFSAFATSFFLSKDVLTEQLEARKALMHSMMNYYAIPWQTQKEVIQLFPTALNNGTEAHFRSEIELLPGFMQTQLSQYFNAHVLKTVPLFRDVPSERVLALSNDMTKRAVARLNVVYDAGDPAREFFVIVHGIVELVIERPQQNEIVTLETLSDGGWFGEELFRNASATDGAPPQRMSAAQAMTNCEMVVLQRDSLLELARDFLCVKHIICTTHRARRQLRARARAGLIDAQVPAEPGGWNPLAMLENQPRNQASASPNGSPTAAAAAAAMAAMASIGATSVMATATSTVLHGDEDDDDDDDLIV